MSAPSMDAPVWTPVRDFDDLPGQFATTRRHHGGHVLRTGRRGTVLRELLVNHAAHHRGQLTVYYRLLGVPVPRVYGPSADEP